MPRKTLNPAQHEILAWVRDGASDSTYDNYDHRIVARALHNRGLVVVAGRGKSWNAVLTDDGSYYLTHREYPPLPESSIAPVAKAVPVKSTKPTPRSGKQPKKSPATRIGPTDAMMMALIASPGSKIEIEYTETASYQRLARFAEQFKKIPEGMQITVEIDRQSGTAYVKMHPLPEWRMKVLDPVPVPGSLRGASDIVKKLQLREDFDIHADQKNRALRLAQALVAEAEFRGYKAKFVSPPSKDRWGYVQRRDRNQGHFMLILGEDEYRLSIFQMTERQKHVPSKSELLRAGRGYGLTQWDVVSTGLLGIRIDTTGVNFWGSDWKDTAKCSLEEMLAQVLQELELRHKAEEKSRDAEERRQIERKRKWEIAREKAVLDLTDSHRAELLVSQTAKWREVATIRDYADAIVERAQAKQDDDARRDALEWAEWARRYADRIDPLQQRLSLPEPPEVTHEALQPFMDGWSTYGPESSRRW